MRLYSNRLPGSSFVQPTRACEGLWRPVTDMGIVHSDHVYDNLIPAHGNCRIFHMHMNPSMTPTHHICWRSRPGRLLERTRPSPRAITIRNLAGEMCVSVLEEGSLLHHSAPLISSILMGVRRVTGCISRSLEICIVATDQSIQASQLYFSCITEDCTGLYRSGYMERGHGGHHFRARLPLRPSCLL